MLIQWNKDILPKNPFEFQRLSFKSDRNLVEATRHAEQIVRLLDGVHPKSIAPGQKVKLIAIYKKAAYKDWENEPNNGELKKARNFIKERQEQIEKFRKLNKNKTKPITFLKESDLKVR